MFNYHSGLEATHPYSSSWYQWPTMVRPIWYYSGYVTDAVKEGISAFGNPLVWWGGIPAFLYVLYLLVTHSSFLRALTGKADASSATTPCPAENIMLPHFWWLATWRNICPGSSSPESPSSTHYFPSTPFVVLMIVYSLMQLKKRVSNRTFAVICCAYAVLAFGLFLLFYPVLSGQPVDVDFVVKYLRWRDTWVLISG